MLTYLIELFGRGGALNLLFGWLWLAFGDLAKSGLTLLVSSHVMDEASRCDDLMLLRDGQLLAHDSVAAILASTGASDIESAFLSLVEGA